MAYAHASGDRIAERNESLRHRLEQTSLVHPLLGPVEGLTGRLPNLGGHGLDAVGSLAQVVDRVLEGWTGRRLGDRLHNNRMFKRSKHSSGLPATCGVNVDFLVDLVGQSLQVCAAGARV